MLELARFPSCVLHCHTLFEDTLRQRMSERKHSGSTRDASRSEHKDKSTHGPREHRHGRSSANDPSISSTHSNKHVSSNLRSHPRADLRDSPGVNHLSVKSNGGRKRNCEDEEGEDVWVEHTSSSGRIYFYNKRNGVSQWEKPKSLAKRPKTEDYSKPQPSSSTTSSISSTSTKHTSQSHPYTSSSHSHAHSLSSKEPTHRSYSMHHTPHTSHLTPHTSHHTPHSTHYQNKSRERERPHSSHHHSNSASRSSSKSTSTSPIPTPRGRGHYDKTTPTRHSRSLNKRSSSPKPLPSSTSISPGPSSSSLTPHSISQSLVATQHYIDQTSAIIKHQQKLFSATGDVITSVQSSPSTKHTPHTLHASYMTQLHQSARQRLSYSTVPSNGPLLQDSTRASTPLTPVHNSGSALVSPQLAGMENLHPLQRALLLQQQQQQQQQVQLLQDPSTNNQYTPQPSSFLPSTPSHPPLPPPTATPPLSALPSHLLPQPPHLTSPYSSSPPSLPSSRTTPPQMHSLAHLIPGPYTPQSQSQSVAIFPYVITPSSTPISGIYMADASASSARGFVAAASPPVRAPMSRLGKRERGSDSSKFPDPSTVETVAPSQASLELFDRGLAERCWGPALDGLQRQLDSNSREVLSHRNREALYFQGRLKRSQLSLDTSRVRTTTRRERLLALEQLLGEIDQR